jgi:UDP-N-acetylmuramoylalanine--D-glutamate ligase
MPPIGQHNRQNTWRPPQACVAGLNAEQIGSRWLIFQNADRRLQPVGEINGARYVNDSKANNVEAAWYALTASSSLLCGLRAAPTKATTTVACLQTAA